MAGINKLDAAERLITSAIAMSERNDDPLAIHVVASSALSLLRELIKGGGDDYGIRVLREGLFIAASARIKGEELTIPVTEEMEPVIEKVMSGIERGEVTQASDLVFNFDPDEIHKLLSFLTRPYNSLKHAQRDPLATMDEGDFDPQGAIIHALTAMGMVDPTRQCGDYVVSFLEKHNL
jgi:hypothetical protein